MSKPVVGSLGDILPGPELAQLYRLTDKLYRARDLDAVCDAALDAITSTLHCSRASILLFDSKGTAQFKAWRGLSNSYRSMLRGHSPWKHGEPDPSPLFVSDIEESAEAEWIRTPSGPRGFALWASSR